MSRRGLSKIVVNVFGCGPQYPRIRARKSFAFRWSTGKQSFVEGNMARITNEQQIAITVVPRTAAGRVAAIDGDVIFTSSDETVATVTSTGPNSALVVAVGVGATQIVATFDADLDEDETREIVLSGAVEVVAAEAEQGVIEFGTPELQPIQE